MDAFNDAVSIARDHLEKKELQPAVEAYLSALKITDKKSEKAIAWAELAWVFYSQQNFEETINAVENVFIFDDQYAAPEDLYRLLGFSWLGLGNDEKALVNLQKTIDIDRSSAKQQITMYELAKLYFRMQNYKESHDLIEEIEAYFYQTNKEYWLSILFYKGFIYYFSKNTVAAEDVFENLLENAADDKRRATALYGLAYIANEKKDYLKTINLCEATLKSDEQFFDKESLAFLTATAFYNLDRIDIFEKYYLELKKIYPDGRYKKELEAIDREIQEKKARKERQEEAQKN